MTRLNRTRPLGRLWFILFAFLLLPSWAGDSYGDGAKPLPSPTEIRRLGDLMYRKGILPSGEPIQAFVKGDLPVPGYAFSCESCHQRSGFGCIEGGVVTPPATGNKLYEPLQTLYKRTEQTFPPPPRRPAYTDATLAEVIRSGEVPGGGQLNDVMPRYMLDDDDMAIMIAYLKELTRQNPPGVTDTTIHFATVIAEDVSPALRDAMLTPLETYVKIKNSQANQYGKSANARSRLMAELMLVSKEMATRKISLSRWLLKGAPETWRAQLEEYQRKEPVFALLAGITNGEWAPIHRFSEDNRIPCLFPVTDFPVISGTDWYTLYISKGYYQEGEGIARYLNKVMDSLKGKPVLQIVRDSREGKALSAGFQDVWKELGRTATLTVTLKAGEMVSGELLKRVLADEKPGALLVWDGANALTGLETLAETGDGPAMLFLSGRYLGKDVWSVPDRIRSMAFLTFPYTFTQTAPKSTSMGMGSAVAVPNDLLTTLSQGNSKVQNPSWLIASQMNSITLLLNMVLMDLWGNYYPDNFLDVIGMEPDLPSTAYGRLSFGPGQRYASKGCYIVQLSGGPKPELIKKSDWVIH